jgi:carbamoyl-phosphate synthase large subunit
MESYLTELANLEHKKIFVSGAAGVIGKELVSILHRHGAKLLACDKKPRPQNWPHEIQYRSGDLNFIKNFELNNFKPEIFIHLAAVFGRSEESSEFWDEGFQNNVKLSHYLLDLVKDINSLKKIVFASSYLVYDPSMYIRNSHEHTPTGALCENSLINPRNLTGAAKLLHESELAFIEKHSNPRISTISARIFRGYGRGSNDVVSRWVRAGLANQPIDVFLPEGSFDYIYASDTAEGLARLSVADFSGIINLGTGKPRKIRHVIENLKTSIPNLDFRFSESSERIECSYADTTLLRTVLGWEPRVTLEEAIPEIVEYETNRNIKVPTIKIFISSASSKVPLLNAFTQASATFATDSLVYVGDADEKCLSAFISANFWNMPRTTESNFDQILSWLKSKEIQLVVPTRDGELEFFAKHEETFRSNAIFVLGSSLATISACLDKQKFYEELKGTHPVIPTCTDFDKDVLGEGPYVVKERFGAGSLLSILNVSETQAKAFSKNLKNPIFQPHIQGQEFSIDAYVTKSGTLHGLVVRERILIRNGESQVSKTKLDANISELTKSVAKKLDLRGHFVLQLIKNENKLHILECNPRVGGASTLSFAAGLNTPLWSILEALEEDLGQYPFVPIIDSIELVRSPTDAIFDTRF